MKRQILILAATLLAGSMLCAAPRPGRASKPNVVDREVNALLRERGLTPSGPAENDYLARRIYLVMTARIPTADQTRAFLRNPDRIALVDSLLASEGWVELQVLRWGDMLRIKSEFPSCMWPNAVQAYNKWLTDRFRSGVGYDQIVYSLLTATGSNFRQPAVNFFRAGNDRSPAKFASDAALLFLGRRSAPESWQPFFSQVKFKSSKEWKEDILWLDIDVPEPPRPVRLEGREIPLRHGEDWRVPFAQWMTAPGHREFARAFCNRLWSWLMGYGIIEPVDDLSGGPVNPALLDALTDFFLESHYDIRALAREILTSEAFARSTRTAAGNQADATGRLGSHYPLRRLDSEPLNDAVCDITGVPDLYASRAPEPFTNYPPGTRAVEVGDGTVTTPQLDLFGRPSRDVALESGRDGSVNAKQALYLLNATTLQEKLARSPWLESLDKGDRDPEGAVREIYLRVLSREATPAEVEAVLRWSSRFSGYTRFRKTNESLVWALLNSDEFIFLN
jgi:hypothetical protein